MNTFEKGVEQARSPEVIRERQEGLERFSRLSIADKDEIIAAANGDEEAAFWIALAFEHPEREQKLIEQLTKYKPYIVNSRNILRVAGPLLERSSSYPPEEVGDTVQNPEARIDKIFSYFKPDQKPEQIVVVPSDNLTSATSGRSWRLGENGYVISHSTNPENFDHETAHLVINPMVEGLDNILTEEEKRRILAMGTEKLQEEYGDDWYPMLCEELINTYTECVKRNKTPESFESFQQKIQSISDEDFNETLHSKDKGESLRQLGIKTKSELLERAGEYYDRYIKNQLRESLYEIYKDYDGADSGEGFESILKRDIRKVLAK